MVVEVFAKYSDWDTFEDETSPVILKYISADSLKNLKEYLIRLYDSRMSIVETKGIIRGKSGIWTFTPHKEFYYDVEELQIAATVINLNGKFFSLLIQ